MVILSFLWKFKGPILGVLLMFGLGAALAYQNIRIKSLKVDVAREKILVEIKEKDLEEAHSMIGRQNAGIEALVRDAADQAEKIQQAKERVRNLQETATVREQESAVRLAALRERLEEVPPASRCEVTAQTYRGSLNALVESFNGGGG